MSAASVIVDDQRSFLLTDTARYADDGTITGMGSKVAALPRLRMAIAMTGKMASNSLKLAVAAISVFEDQDNALRALPGILADVAAAKERADWGDLGRAGDNIQMMVATYSRKRSRAEGFMLGVGEGAIGDDYEPLTLKGVRRALSPWADVAPIDKAFAPLAHGKAILEAQRQIPLHHSGGIMVIGGAGELTTVDRTGVKTRTIIEWPDQIGQKVRL